MQNPPYFRRFILPLLWVLSAAVVVKILLLRLFDGDLWWHLAAGREMVEKHIFLRSDIFSHSLLGAEWVNFEWLFEVVAYLIYQAGGLWGLYAAKFLFSLTALLLLIVSLRQAGAKGPWLLFISWLGFLMLRTRLFERAELMTLNMLPLFMVLILWVRDSDSMKTKYVPWILFALMVLWANFHGGFVYGLGLMGALTVGAHWMKAEKSFRQFLTRSFLLVLAATLINPHGVYLFVLIMRLFVEFRHFPSLIQEWSPSVLSKLPVFWGVLIAALIYAGEKIINRNQKARFWIPAVLLFAVWGVASYRNAALFTFIALPFLVENGREFFKKERLGFGLAALPLLLNVSAFASPIYKEPVMWRLFPRQACDFIRKANIEGTLYNDYDWGGYLQWELGPEKKTFLDGRYLFLPLLQEMKNLNIELQEKFDEDKWSNYLTEKGIDYAITPYVPAKVFLSSEKAPFDLSMVNVLFPRAEWALVYWDDVALVFVRRIDKFNSIINAFEYRTLWPYNVEQTKHFVQIGMIPKADIQKELERHQVETGFTVVGNELENFLRTVK